MRQPAPRRFSSLSMVSPMRRPRRFSSSSSENSRASRNVSSANPSRVVMMCAPAMLAPGRCAGAGKQCQQAWMVRREDVSSVIAVKASVCRSVDSCRPLVLGAAQQLGVLDPLSRIGTQPIVRIMAVDVALDLLGRPIGEGLAQRILRLGDSRLPRSPACGRPRPAARFRSTASAAAAPSSRSTRPARRRECRRRSAAAAASVAPGFARCRQSRGWSSDRKDRGSARCCSSSDDARSARTTVSVSAGVSPRRGHTFRAMRAPTIE